MMNLLIVMAVLVYLCVGFAVLWAGVRYCEPINDFIIDIEAYAVILLWPIALILLVLTPIHRFVRWAVDSGDAHMAAKKQKPQEEVA